MSNIPPEIMALLEELSQGGIAEDQNELLGAQYKTADELRRTPMPEMRRYGANHVVAPNAMEVAAAAIDRYRGNQMQRESMDQMKGNVNTAGRGARALMLAKLLRDYPAQVAAPEAPPAPVAPVMQEDPIPGLGMEGPDITEGRAQPRKPKVKPTPGSYGTTGAW